MIKSTLDKFDLVVASRDLESLGATLDRVKQSTILPNKVIWCLPPNFSEYVGEVEASSYSFDVVILKSQKGGQVHQRAFGISHATSEFVVFMDDDIQFCAFLFERLMKHILMYHPCVVSPLIFNADRTPLYRDSSKIGKVVDLIFHGFPYRTERFGKIGLSGFPKYIGLEEFKSNAIEVEWLPGGVQIIKKRFFPKKGYYPYKGKAYCEDLFLSEVYRKNHLTMHIIPIIVYTEVAPLQSDFKSMYYDSKARLGFVLSTNRSVVRMIVWYFCLFIRGLFRG